MALWRAEALRRLPELREKIDSAWEIMALWIELQYEFAEAYKKEPRDESLIARIYSFADWCMEAPRNPDAGHDPFTSLMVAFYEDIPTIRPARDDMPRWFTYSEVVQNKQAFSYHIGEEQYNELVAYMAKNRHKYVPRAKESKRS